MYGIFDMMGERQKAQMKIVLAKVAAQAATAPKGSAEQQVGTFLQRLYGHRRPRCRRNGAAQPQLDAIASIGSMDDLVRYLATAQATTSAPPALLALKPEVGFNDSSRYVIDAGAGMFGVPFDDVLAETPDSPRRAGYQTYLDQVMQVAGYAPDEAARLAALAVSIEAALQPGKTAARRCERALEDQQSDHARRLRPDPELDLTASTSRRSACPRRATSF